MFNSSTPDFSRRGVPSKVNNIAAFHVVDVKIEFEEIDGIRYLSESVRINYTENEYLDQC